MRTFRIAALALLALATSLPGFSAKPAPDASASFVERVTALRVASTDPAELTKPYRTFSQEFPAIADVVRYNSPDIGWQSHLQFLSRANATKIETGVLASIREKLAKSDARFASALKTAFMPEPADSPARLALIESSATWLRQAETLGELDTTFALDRLARADRLLGPADPLRAEIATNGLIDRLHAHANAVEAARASLVDTIAARKPADPAALAALSAKVKADAALALRFALRAHGTSKIVYATRTQHSGGHFYESIGYNGNSAEFTHSRSGGRLVIWDVATGKETVLVDDAQAGAVRDPCVSYDGKTVLFSWRKSGENYYHLHTIPAEGGTPTRLTDGPWNDFEAIFTPDDHIVFASTRCHRWIPCFEAEVANLHRCDLDGQNIQSISSNVETEGAPWMLPDGRIVYMRWEYTEKDRAVFHTLWTVNPDGTNHQIYFGNVAELRNVWNDPKPIPGTNQVVFVAHNHGGNDHKGTIAIVDQEGGPNDHTRIHYVTAPYQEVKIPWRDPFPVAQDLFVAARGQALIAIDRDGRELELLRLPDAPKGSEQVLVNEPRVLAPHPREHRIPTRCDLSKDYGEFIIGDIYEGRYMDGVKRGDIKDLLIVEELPKPVHHNGHTEPLAWNGTFMLERVLGTVPVEEDGSAYFKAPPLRSLMFVARDKDGLSVKRMQSFATTMPGERQSCLGCHDNRTRVAEIDHPLKALTRDPSEIRPFKNHPEVFDFPRDIQPILNRNCMPCHDGNQRQGGVVLDGDMDLWFTQAYVTLHTRDQIGAGYRALKAGMAPREIGSSYSPLVKKLLGGHHDVKATPEEIERVALWVDSAGVWAGTYAAVNTTEGAQTAWDKDLAKVLTKNCASCHNPVVESYGDPTRSLLRSSAPATGPSFGEIYGIRVNFTDLDRSLLLRAPLSPDKGGLGLCKDKAGKAVYTWKDRNDPGYAAVRARLKALQDKYLPLRYDRPGFRPLPSYVREMRRQNLLPETFDIEKDAWNPYDLDRAYWRSFWHVPKAPATP